MLLLAPSPQRRGFRSLLLGLAVFCLAACNRDSLDGDGDGFTELTNDCDDSDPNVHPEAVEVCYNGIDDNCNGEEDEEGATSGRVWYQDYDGDGYGKEDLTTLACTQPDGYAAEKWDCQEDNPDINPGAPEVCDGVDNDCDGEVDEPTADDAVRWYPDGDGDGYGDATVDYPACSSPGEGWVRDGSDCNDADPLVSVEQTESCFTPYDDNCDGLRDGEDAYGCTDFYGDLDGDGYPGTPACLCEPDAVYSASEATDCDDEDPGVFPGSGTRDAGWQDRNCDGMVAQSLAAADLRFSLSARKTTSSSTVRAVSWAGGDLDGDGLDDLAVATLPRSGSGYRNLYVASGATLADQHDLHETATAVLAGAEVGAFGDTVTRNVMGFQPQITDLDADGFADLVVVREVQRDDESHAYEASVFLGPVSGTLDLLAADSTLQIEKSQSASYSRNLRDAGQWSDGRSLLAVTDTHGGSAFGAPRGGVVTLLGWDSATAALEAVGTVSGINENQYLGHAVSDAGDVNGDGVRDRAVATTSKLTSDPFGEGQSSKGGVIELFTDSTEFADTSIVSNAYYHRIVDHLGGPGDLNGDGHPDLVFSALTSHIGAYDAGRVHVLWGPLASGMQQLAALPQVVIHGDTDSQLVECPSVVPDTNGDSRDDLAIGAYGVFAETGARGATYLWLGEDLDASVVAGDGMAVVHDGKSGSQQIHGFCNWQWQAAASPGDVNGDGLGDLLVRGAVVRALDPSETESLFLFLGGTL